MPKSTSDMIRVASVAVKANILISASFLMNRITSAPTRGIKITMERIGNPRGFIVKYDGMFVIPLNLHIRASYKTNQRIAKNKKSDRPM